MRIIIGLTALLMLTGCFDATMENPYSAPEDVGRYEIQLVKETTYLIDTKIGRTWILKTGEKKDSKGELVWVPIERLEPKEIEEIVDNDNTDEKTIDLIQPVKE